MGRDAHAHQLVLKCDALKTVRHGSVYISRLLLRELDDDFIDICMRRDERLSEEPLTTRELEVLKLLSEGNSSREIAEFLSISVRTAEHHRASIMKKLNIKNIADLVKYAIRKGYTNVAI